jgi:hypothetical protein
MWQCSTTIPAGGAGGKTIDLTGAGWSVKTSNFSDCTQKADAAAIGYQTVATAAPVSSIATFVVAWKCSGTYIFHSSTWIVFSRAKATEIVSL